MERRQFARVPVSLQIKFTSLESLEQMLTGATSNVSFGGLFIKTNNPRPVDTEVIIEIPDPSGNPVIFNGLVRSIKYYNGAPSGMGIEFKDIDGPGRSILSSIMDKAS